VILAQFWRKKIDFVSVKGFVLTPEKLFKSHSMLYLHGDEINWQSQFVVSSLGEGQEVWLQL
jgi:hypothetical protein